MDNLEGDTNFMFHVDTKDPGNIIIRGNHTNIFIILHENIQKPLQSQLWFDAGLDYDNSRNHIDMSRLSKELDYVKVLPIIYAYTGICVLPTFYRKKKVRPLLLITKNNHL